MSAPGDLPRTTWQQIIRAGDACRGDVLVIGPAPRALVDYLETSIGCRPVTGPAALPDGTADTIVLWEHLTTDGAAGRVRDAARRLKPGGTIVAVTHPNPFPDDLGPEAVARVLTGELKGNGPAEVKAEGHVVIATAGAPRPENDRRPAPARGAAGTAAPLVSAVVPVYNGENEIDRSLRSLRSQTYRNLEILVIDDGSTDGTAEVVKRHADEDPRVRYVYKEHSGRPQTRNAGVREARGEFLAWLDADDEALPNRIRTQVEVALENGAADIIHGDALYLDPDGVLQKHRRFPAFAPEALPAILLRRGPMLNVTLLVRRDVYDRIGGYDESFPRAQDTELYVRCAMADGLTYRHVPAPLVHVCQKPLNRPELLPSRRDTYCRIATRLIEHFGLERLMDDAGRASGEDPRLNVARVLVRESIVRQASGRYPLLERATQYLNEVAAEGHSSDSLQALALLGDLAEYLGDRDGAQRFRRAAGRPVARASGCRPLPAVVR